MNRQPSAPGAAQFYDRFGPFLLAALAAVIMALVLFSGGGAGLSNNGDFGRVLSTNSLDYAESTGSFAYEDTFRMVFQGDSAGEKLWNLLFNLDNTAAYPSIHLVFVRASLAGNLALNVLTGQSLDTYHIQVLGLIYLLCYAGLLLLLFRSFKLPSLWCDLLVKLAVLFVLCDEGYITYFNSLYSEPVQMLGLLAMAAFGLRLLSRRGSPGWNAGWYFLSCVVYGWSKFINLPAAALCALGMGAVLFLRAEKKYRKWLCGGAAACVAVLGAVYLSLPGWMDYETNYNAVFYGVLKDTTPEQTEQYLSDLGLPDYMAEYANSNYYMDRVAPARESEQFRADFSQVSKFDLLFFYLSHPGYYLEKLDVAMAHTGFIRPYYLSNLDSTHPRLTFAGRFGGWSWLRSQLPVNTWLAAGLITAAGCWALWQAAAGRKGAGRDKRSAALLVLTLLGAMAYQFLIPTVTNGEGDLAKHMFAFAQFIDLLLLLLLAWLGYRLSVSERAGRPAAVLAGGTAGALCLLLAVPAGISLVRERLPHDGLEAGSYVQLGVWEGEPLLWQAVERQEDGSWLLLAAEAVDSRPFDRDGDLGSSRWSDSDLRAWLNGDFLTSAFDQSEQEMLVTGSHRVLLSIADRSLAGSGFNDFFAFHVPAYSDRGMEEAVAMDCTDAVRLPDIGLMASLSRAGLLSGPPCWMDTPYFNNGSMVRILGADGYFYMRDAADQWGVRPVVALAAGTELTGSGSVGDPFIPEL
ncbi:DUF6273 domain-containing protein [uncultured Pseudoflavonifractor sp.]|uniref:glycan biosynthesis hexose transferase WsfD n=1 Tax=uncultured Pseudoflavonifractor sp. TaxID=1221379 RepID=UPI0025DDB4E9|nr:DUF6273 domain-containing protein [uncultured Pseudoflavonifractor sp.]